MAAPDPAVVTVKVPFAVRKRGGRKLVLAPDGAPVPPAAPHVDSTLVKAIARAFRWQKMLETGRYATIKEIANAERINPSYVSRVLRLTLLAPATVEAILSGRPNMELTLPQAMAPFPIEWSKQYGLGAGDSRKLVNGITPAPAHCEIPHPAITLRSSRRRRRARHPS
jgi:hypothetical protein